VVCFFFEAEVCSRVVKWCRGFGDVYKVLIVAGVAFVFWPAALTVAGVMLLAASWRLER